jgi:Helix-turn-helix of DDE superfamily endonuclease
VLVTLVALRFQLPHKVLAVMFGVDRSTVTRAVREVRPLLAQRGFAVPDRPGIRLKTLADVFAYAAAEGVTLRIDGTEVPVRRPRANRDGRKAFVSGKKKQNTMKPTVVGAPPRKPAKDAPSERVAAYEQARKQQSSRRIGGEHTIAEPKQWRPLQRYLGRREYFDETFQAIAGLVSDRTALR